MREAENRYLIQDLREKLDKEGVESVYSFIKKCKISSTSSEYSALINDLIACCPSADQWNYPRVKESFKQDVIYYCDYYLSLLG